MPWSHQTHSAKHDGHTRRRLWLGLIVLSAGWIMFVFVVGLAGSEGDTGTAAGIFALLALGLLGSVGVAYRRIRRRDASTERPILTAVGMGAASFLAAFVLADLAVWALVSFS